MQRSWYSSLIAPLAPEQPKGLLVSSLGRLFGQRMGGAAAVSRYVGHLVIGLALVLVISGRLPKQIPVPPIASVIPQQPAIGQRVIPRLIQTEAVDAPRFLQPAVVPFTSHVAREAVPIIEPKRAVRTSVAVYRVEPGDSVLGIAEKFGIKGTSLLWANEKLADNPDFLQVGQELNILPVDGAYHTVAQGETLESIALKFKVEPDVIAHYDGNHLEAPYVLQVGQALIIPAGIMPYVPKRVFAYDGTVPKGAKKGTGAFSWPMSGYITQRFWEGHRAIDIGAPTGTPIVAADSGYVAVAQWSDVGYGRMLIIDHGNGYQTLYGHMDTYFVEAGQSVAKGQALGKCGSTGNSTGSHLHFEVIKNGVRRNPFTYLP